MFAIFGLRSVQPPDADPPTPDGNAPVEAGRQCPPRGLRSFMMGSQAQPYCDLERAEDERGGGLDKITPTTCEATASALRYNVTRPETFAVSCVFKLMLGHWPLKQERHGMKKTFIAAGALALAISAVPVTGAHAQAHYGGARRAAQVRRAAPPAPKKDPACDNKLQKDNMAWMEFHHCYGR